LIKVDEGKEKHARTENRHLLLLRHEAALVLRG
jgi:hypothetical protein